MTSYIYVFYTLYMLWWYIFSVEVKNKSYDLILSKMFCSCRMEQQKHIRGTAYSLFPVIPSNT